MMWHAQQRHNHVVAQQLRLSASVAVRLRAHLAHNTEMHVDRTNVGGAPQSDRSAAHLHAVGPKSIRMQSQRVQITTYKYYLVGPFESKLRAANV
jgi:hypothetical protein